MVRYSNFQIFIFSGKVGTVPTVLVVPTGTVQMSEYGRYLPILLPKLTIFFCATSLCIFGSGTACRFLIWEIFVNKVPIFWLVLAWLPADWSKLFCNETARSLIGCCMAASDWSRWWNEIILALIGLLATGTLPYRIFLTPSWFFKKKKPFGVLSVVAILADFWLVDDNVAI